MNRCLMHTQSSGGFVVGAVLYTKAEGVFPADAARARRLVNWSWISITVPVVIAVAAAAAVTVLRG